MEEALPEWWKPAFVLLYCVRAERATAASPKANRRK